MHGSTRSTGMAIKSFITLLWIHTSYRMCCPTQRTPRWLPPLRHGSPRCARVGHYHPSPPEGQPARHARHRHGTKPVFCCRHYLTELPAALHRRSCAAALEPWASLFSEKRKGDKPPLGDHKDRPYRRGRMRLKITITGYRTYAKKQKA